MARGTAAKRRQKQRERVQRARREWVDANFGLRLDRLHPGGGGEQVRLSWTIAREPFMALVELTRLRALLGGIEAELVIAGRAEGQPWGDLGFALEVSGEAARRRHPQADALAEELLAGALAEEPLDG